MLDKFSEEATESYPACIAAVTEMCRSASLLIHDHWSSIEAVVGETLLPQQDNRFPTSQSVSKDGSCLSPQLTLLRTQEAEEDEPWVDFDDLAAMDQAKILALKLVMNRTLFYPEGRPAKNELALHIRRLCAVVEHDGYLSFQLNERFVIFVYTLLKCKTDSPDTVVMCEVISD